MSYELQIYENDCVFRLADGYRACTQGIPFRNLLIKNGFFMMQESVYCRMVLNATVEKSVAETIKREKPSAGIVQLLTVTEKQFAAMTYITGKYITDVVDSDEKVVIL